MYAMIDDIYDLIDDRMNIIDDRMNRIDYRNVDILFTGCHCIQLIFIYCGLHGYNLDVIVN